jgi:hypothetical protein
MSSRRLVASPRRTAPGEARKKKPSPADEEILSLEAELEKGNLELSTVRNERDKQRQQLASLSEEHAQLSHQKEQRLKRNQLSSQLQDLNKSLKRKISKKERAMEDLEQAKSRHRQLKRTLELLQGGVQSILSKSYYYDQKDNKTEEGKLRAQQRQQLLKQLLTEEFKMMLLTSSLSSLNFDIHTPRQNGRLEDEDDEINDRAEDIPTITLFADKNKRMDSANSELSANDYMEHANTTYRIPSIAAANVTDNNNHSGRSRSRKSRSKDLSTSGRRSPSNGGSSSPGRNRSNSRDRSSRSSNSQGKSQSRRGRRPNANTTRQPNDEQEEEHDTINHSTSTSKDSGLASMIESSRNEHNSDDPSDDTPKTANTNG